ncbi:MAG: hypothetical protein C0501_08940 [Isosphaera sp.]|nr:hypothetical protein [Isosphaera sp.]
MRLTCPTCRTGLEVPDGTTDLVRCPACREVFAPDPPEAEEVEEPPEPVRKPARRPAPPRKKPAPTKAPAATPENRDFDPIDPAEKPRKRRRADEDDGLSAAERAALRAAFGRAAVGCKLVWGSLVLFTLSMMLIIAFWFQSAVSDPSPAFIVGAGAVGAVGWVLGAVGVGLCLSGPPSPGHWGYGIAAAVAVGLHLVLLGAAVAKGTDYNPGREAEANGPAAVWGLVPTRLDAVTFYLTLAVYRDQELVPKGEMGLSIAVGLAELVRTMLLLMLLSCLARATGDEDLSHECTRAAGISTIGPGFLALGVLVFAVVVVETHAGSGTFAKVMFTTIRMGTYAVLSGCVFAGLMAARKVADACDEPFQSHLDKA